MAGQVRRKTTSTALRVGLACVLAGSLLSAAGSPAAASGSHIAYGWGDNSFDQLGNVSSLSPVAVPVTGYATDVIQLVTDGDTSASLRADGSVWTWGSGEAGMLGDGSPEGSQRMTPQPVPGLPPIAQLSMNFEHALAVGIDGSLWTWGSNGAGDLGNGHTDTEQPFAAAPVRVPLAGTVLATAAGNESSAAVLADGSVWTWGTNVHGELGDGTPTTTGPRTTPMQAATPSGITQVAAGAGTVVALRSDGTIWAWGDNEVGELGQPTAQTDMTTPLQVPGVANVTRIAEGWFHTEVLEADGTVWGWGSNHNGQLGNDSPADTQSEPVQAHLPTGTHATALAAGDRLTAAVLSDGTVAAWGALYTGDRQVPSAITFPADVTVVGAGGSVVLMTMDPQPTPVPQFVNSAWSQASAIAATSYLRLGTVSMVETPCDQAGAIIGQSLPAGSTALPDTPVNITYVDPNTSCSVTVPNIVGDTRAGASGALNAAGLNLGNETDVVQPACGNGVGRIVAQSPTAGSTVRRSGSVNFSFGVRPSGNHVCQ